MMWKISFTDEHVQTLDFNESADLIFISCMLTCQIPRGWEIADTFREMGKTVVMGGISTHLHAEESMTHGRLRFSGRSRKGRTPQVLEDFMRGELKPLYDFRGNFPDTALIKPARRSILDRELYNYRGVQMVALIHASRGCRFKMFPVLHTLFGADANSVRDQLIK